MNNNIKFYKKIFNMLKEFKKKIIVSTALIIFTSLINTIIPFINSKIVDDGLAEMNFALLLKLVVSVVILEIIYHGAMYFQAIIQNDIYNEFTQNYQMQALRHSMRIKSKYIKDNGLYKIVNDAEFNISVISKIASQEFIGVVVDIFQILGSIVGLAIISWKLTFLTLIIVPIKLLVVHYFGKKKNVASKELVDSQRELSSWRNDVFEGINEVKLWNIYRKKESEFKKLNSTRYRILKKMTVINEANSFVELTLEKGIFNLVYILGALLIWRNELTLGGLFAFISYTGYLFEPVFLLTSLKLTLDEVKPALKSYEEFLQYEEEEDKEDKILLKKNYSPQNITFKNVNFSYSENEQILNDLNFNIKRGEKVAFIGENGSGKTTAANLLLRFLEPTSGSIFIDDINIKDINLQDYRDLFAVMSQNTYLFNTDIRNNITMFGRNSKNFDESKCKEIKLLSFLHRFKEGLDSDVGFMGSKVSGGEKQKIALMRVILKKSKILVLDEATANYDVKSEREFDDIVLNSKYNMMIIITHKTEILQKVDKIILFKHGGIADVGSYAELLNRNEAFKEIIAKSNKEGKYVCNI